MFEGKTHMIPPPVEHSHYEIYSYRSPLDAGGSGEWEELSIRYSYPRNKWLLEVESGFSEFLVIPELDDPEETFICEIPDDLLSGITWSSFTAWARESIEPKNDRLYIGCHYSREEAKKRILERLSRSRENVERWIMGLKETESRDTDGILP